MEYPYCNTSLASILLCVWRCHSQPSEIETIGLEYDEIACGSLLDLLKKHHIFPPSNCREGTCMSSSTSMTSGTLSYQPEPFGEPFDGETLLCSARPETGIELDI